MTGVLPTHGLDVAHTHAAVTGTPTPQDQAEATLQGGAGTATAGETHQAVADATLVEVSGGPSNISAALQAPPISDFSSASSLISQVAAQISSQGVAATGAHARLSPSATYALLKS